MDVSLNTEMLCWTNCLKHCQVVVQTISGQQLSAEDFLIRSVLYSISLPLNFHLTFFKKKGEDSLINSELS